MNTAMMILLICATLESGHPSERKACLKRNDECFQKEIQKIYKFKSKPSGELHGIFIDQYQDELIREECLRKEMLR